MSNWMFIASLMGALASHSAAAVSEGMVLAGEGTARAVIVVAPDAPLPEQHAAIELSTFLEQVSGARFDVRHEAGQERSRILVGRGAAAWSEPAVAVAELDSEELIIRTVGNDLILAGGIPRGTLYAVYTFLEDQVGCRWWSSTASHIPRDPTLRIPNLDVQERPPLEYRESFWFDAFDGDWAARNKCNGHSCRLEQQHGGRHHYEGFVHTFYRLIPPDTYFDEHPEWFSEIGGTRRHERAQLCLTNEDLQTELVLRLRQRLHANPAATIASVSQNDWHGNCECERCAAVDAAEGGPAGSLLRFVNAVADEIATSHPAVAISTLAYQHTRRPPTHARPRPNVIVRLCSIECDFSRPLTHDTNRTFRDDLVGWSAICDRLYIWDYVTNFKHHILPHPNLNVLGPNLRFFAEHSVKGVFEQGAYTTAGAELAELRAWVLAKLLWRPTRDGRALIEEFVHGYYGAAADGLLAYIDTIHDAAARSGESVGCFASHTSPFLSFETLRVGWTHLVEAEHAVAEQSELRTRVQAAQLPVLYAFLMRWDAFRTEADAAGAPWPLADDVHQVLHQFMNIARARNVTRLSEWNLGFDALNQAVGRMQR